MAPCKGKDAIRSFITGFLGGMASSVEFAIQRQLVSGRTVMNERVDTIVMQDRSISLPVCGVFELTEAGKISAWRDYFDAGQFAGS